jgi:ribokinase
MFDLVAFGAAMVDFFIKSESFIVKDDLLALPYSSKNEVSEGHIISGGGASNASVSCSRLGLNTACVSLVGRDHLHHYVVDELNANRVKPLLALDSNSTDYSVILVAPDGGRSVLTNRGPTRLTQAHIPWPDLTNVKWFYITSLEGNLDLLENLIGFAHENNIKVALNPGNRELAQPRRLLPLLAHVEYLQFNKTESEKITSLNVEHPDFWTKVSSFGSSIVAVTNGREGAHILHQGQHFYSPVLNTNPVEETGAGDAFGSAFVSALFHQTHPKDALLWAIHNSASVVSHFGAKAGLLTLDEITRAISSKP